MLAGVYQVDDDIDPPPGAGAGWDIATIDVATGVERILTRGFAPHTIVPVWSLDDRHVLFLTGSGPGVVRSDGTGLQVFEGPCAWIEPSPDGVFVTCLMGDRVALHPIAVARRQSSSSRVVPSSSTGSGCRIDSTLESMCLPPSSAGGSMSPQEPVWGYGQATAKRHLADLRAGSCLTTEQLIYRGRAEGWL